jgi:type II secretory pathway component PulF
MSIIKKKSRWSSFKVAIDRANFPIDLQLEFIDLFESFSGVQRKERLKRLKEVFTDENGKKCIQNKVLEDLIHFNSIGRYEQGLEKWFHEDVLVMYRVTAYTNDRNSVVDIIKKDISEERALFMDGFVKKMAVPAVMLIISTVGLLTNYFFLAPLFAKIFKIEDIFNELPAGVYYIGRAIEVGGIWFFTFLVALRIWYVYLRNNWVGRERDRWSDKFPFVIYRSFQSARILKMMSLMRESDLKPIDVLFTLRGWVNPYLKWHVEKWIKGFQQGKNKNSFFGVGLLSSKQLIRLRAQQEGGGDDFSKSIMVIADHANKDASVILYKYSRRLKRLIYLIAAVITLFTLQGFGVLFVLTDV